MSASVLPEILAAVAGPGPADGSLFFCSGADDPCHHFCRRHAEPLRPEVEDWFMTDEVEEEEEEAGQEEMEEVDDEEERERELTQAGLLDHLLDEAYSHYYDEPDEWEDLANWYRSRLSCDEPWMTEDGDEEAAEGGAATAVDHLDHHHHHQQAMEFHPAWRPERDGAGTTAASKRRRDWAELVEEQELEEEEAAREAEQQQRASADRRPAARRRANEDRSAASALVGELDLRAAYNDLFFPDPESGRL